MFGLSFDTLTRKLDRGGSLKRQPAAGWMKREEAIMGTLISVELWSDDPAAGEDVVLLPGEHSRVEEG